MKALTIHQPYAELIASGEKRVENRTWATRHRGHLAIHAGSSRVSLNILDVPFDVEDVPFGAVVAVVNVAECVRFADLGCGLFPGEDCSRYAFGPWCWVLENVQRLPEPVTVSGKQGLWNLPPDVVAAIKRQLR